MLGFWSMISSRNSDVAMWDASWHLDESQACQNFLCFLTYDMLFVIAFIAISILLPDERQEWGPDIALASLKKQADSIHSDIIFRGFFFSQLLSYLVAHSQAGVRVPPTMPLQTQIIFKICSRHANLFYSPLGCVLWARCLLLEQNL